ncbi:MAG: hypothetical protein ACLFSQ_12900 [Candidatus Zixiibacteriota bacterium]
MNMLAMKKILTAMLLVLIVGLAFAQDSGDKVNINALDCSELHKLDLTEEQEEAICEQILYGGGFESVYDLLELGVFTPEEFDKIKDKVQVSIIQGMDEDDPLARVDNLYYRISSWLSGEDVSTAAIDDWVDAVIQQPSIQELGYRDLVSLQNVSPQDAFAVMNHRDQVGSVQNRRQLKAIDNITIRGYVSLRNYIGYGEPKKDWRPNGWITSEYNGNSGDYRPGYYLRGRYSYGPFSAGARLDRALGVKLEDDAWYNPGAYPYGKFYVATSRYDLGDLKIRRAVAGDFSASFGEGITLGTYDWFSSRQTGVGWNVRQLGISPDISYSNTYSLRGFGIEANYRFLEASFFGSVKEKPAVLNPDGESFSELIVTAPDAETDIDYGTISELDTSGTDSTEIDTTYQSNLADWEDKVKETMVGFDLTAQPIKNGRIGFTMYRANYDKTWKPDPSTFILDENLSTGDDPEVDARDAEVFNMTYAQDYRSAMGLHGVYNIGNLAISAEYSEIVRDHNVEFRMQNTGAIDTIFGDDTSPLPIGDDPYGLNVKTQLITNRFSILALYRHYDIDYDNPYNRGFSNYQRYKGSILEKDYMLENNAFMSLADDNPRPQAEDGYYFNFFGRATRKLYGTVEFDAFRRLTDNLEYRRIVLKANYRPSGKLMFKLWRKWQGRAASNGLTIMAYEVDEIRFSTVAMLTAYSSIEFQVVHSFFQSPPRPKFSRRSEVASAVDPSDALMLGATINANDYLTIKGGASVYRGWLWNFENNDFAVLESNIDAMRIWVAAQDRLADNLSATFKISLDQPLRETGVETDGYYGYDPDGYAESNIRNSNVNWKLQLDYFF